MVFERLANKNVAPPKMLPMAEGVDIDAMPVNYMHNLLVATNAGGSQQEKNPQLFLRT